MGVNITGYKGLEQYGGPVDQHGEPVSSIEGQEICYEEVWHNKDFPGRCADVAEGTYLYAADSEGVSMAYTVYSNWREQLARLAGYPKVERVDYGVKSVSAAQGAWNATEGPFWELINFSDCEGSIGTAVCAKLVEDFKTFDGVAKMSKDVEFRFYVRYTRMREAFEFGADRGFVKFS